MDKRKLYYIEETHAYYYDGVKIPSVTQILREAGYTDTDFIPSEFADRGTFIHAITELADMQIIDYSIIPGEWVSFVHAYEEFLADKRPSIVETEELVLRELNGRVYAGRRDRLLDISGVYYGADYKTGNYAKWHPLQLVAYFGTTMQLADLYLKKNGDYKFRVLGDEEKKESIEIFEAALISYWYNHKRDWAALKKTMSKEQG